MDLRLGWMFALGGVLFISGVIVRSLVWRRASAERAPTMLESMHAMVEDERSA